MLYLEMLRFLQQQNNTSLVNT